uniref:Phlebovirus_G2 domain-containing protein n=1 Tax=Heterorhabditis bacteriophora TaxID=37862 RepID=A0A1I7WXS2_HETBA
MKVSYACQQGYMRQTVDMNCNNEEQCKMEYRREALLDQIHKELCVQIRKDNLTVGNIRIKRGPTTLKCVKQSLFYTRDTETQVFSKMRCPQMVACDLTKGICENMQSNKVIEELKEASTYSGYSYCERPCGGTLMACLFFLPMKACNFYKVAHIPKTNNTYHIFKCSQWKVYVSIILEETLFNKNIKKKLMVEPYRTYEIGNLKLTIVSMQKEYHILMNKRIAQSSEGTLIIPDEFAVECENEKQAEMNFAQCKNNRRCVCDSQNDPANYQCPTFSLNSSRNSSENKFPISTEAMDFITRNESIIATSSQAEMIVVIESVQLISSTQYIIEQQCTVAMDKLTECHMHHEVTLGSNNCMFESTIFY